MLTYRCLNGIASQYLSEMIHPVTSCDSQYHLQSADSTTLSSHAIRCSTLQDHLFPDAAATAWNSIPKRLQLSHLIHCFVSSPSPRNDNHVYY